MKLILLGLIAFTIVNLVGVNQNVTAQVDIAKIVSQKYELKVDEQIYEIYYGYHGSLEFDVEKLQSEILPEVISMSVNEEKKSLEITLGGVHEQQFFWVMIPFDVMSADGDDFILLIDGVKTGYEFTKSIDDNTIGMVVAPDTQKIEIIGTSVVPEFEGIALLILSVSIVPLLLIRRNLFFQKLC